LNSNLGYFDSFTFILVSCGESCLLVSWCAGDKCGMTDSDKDLDSSRRSSAKDHVPCAVYTVHMKTRARVSWLSLKTKVDSFLIWASKLQLWFGDLSLKFTATIS
jgi:hypothetical protein